MGEWRLLRAVGRHNDLPMNRLIISALVEYIDNHAQGAIDKYPEKYIRLVKGMSPHSKDDLKLYAKVKKDEDRFIVTNDVMEDIISTGKTEEDAIQQHCTDLLDYAQKYTENPLQYAKSPNRRAHITYLERMADTLTVVTAKRKWVFAKDVSTGISSKGEDVSDALTSLRKALKKHYGQMYKDKPKVILMIK